MKEPLFRATEMETADPVDLRGIQEKKLQTQLDYVWRHSPFYRAKLGDAGFRPGDVKSLEDLAGLPFTTKEDIRATQSEFPPLGNHVCASLRDVIRIHTSSGTTGRSSFAGITKMDRHVWTEITARSIYTEGVSDLAALKRDLEHALREKLVIKADVRLVPEGTLPRFAPTGG